MTINGGKDKGASGIKEVKGYILDLDTSLVVECFPDMAFVSKS